MSDAVAVRSVLDAMVASRGTPSSGGWSKLKLADERVRYPVFGARQSYTAHMAYVRSPAIVPGLLHAPAPRRVEFWFDNTETVTRIEYAGQEWIKTWTELFELLHLYVPEDLDGPRVPPRPAVVSVRGAETVRSGAVAEDLVRSQSGTGRGRVHLGIERGEKVPGTVGIYAWRFACNRSAKRAYLVRGAGRYRNTGLDCKDCLRLVAVDISDGGPGGPPEVA